MKCRWMLIFLFILSCAAVTKAETDANRLISLDFKNADLLNVIRVFSDQYGINIVVGEDVTGTVTVRLNNAPLEESLSAILGAHGYGFVVEGNIYRVAPLSQLTSEQKTKLELSEYEQLVTEVIELRYLDGQDAKKVLKGLLSTRGRIEVLERKTVPGWEIGAFGAGASSSSRSSSSRSSSSGSSSRGGAPQTSRSGLITQRRDLPDTYEKSRIIVVTDVPSRLREIKVVLTQIDVMPQQVMIDTMIVELTVDDGFAFGLKWSSLDAWTISATPSRNITDSFTRTKDLDDSVVSTSTLGGSDSRTRTINNLSGNASSDVTTKTGSDTTSVTEIRTVSNMKDSVFTDLKTVVLSAEQLNVVLSALATDEDVDIISNPNILTLDNHEATILVGENFPIFNTSITDQGTVTESLDYYQPVGVSLRVIPQITADQSINMLIHPSISAIGGFITGTTGLRYPRINIREADTQVLVNENQTIVIGGLMTDRQKETITRVPILGDIPLLGLFFRHKSTEKKKVNLIVFVTPRIVRPDEISKEHNYIYDRYFRLKNLENQKNDSRRKARKKSRESMERRQRKRR